MKSNKLKKYDPKSHIHAFRLRRLEKLSEREKRRESRKRVMPVHVPLTPGRRIGPSKHPRRPSFCFHTAYAKYPDRTAVNAAMSRGEVP